MATPPNLPANYQTGQSLPHGNLNDIVTGLNSAVTTQNIIQATVNAILASQGVASGIATLTSAGVVNHAQLSGVPVLDINKEYTVYPNDNTRDSAAGINAAIAALGSGPGIARLTVPGTYRVDSPINLGNGTKSVNSTQQGIRLEGPLQGGNDINAYLLAALAPGATLQASSSFSAPSGGVIQINGPIYGAAFSNLVIDANLHVGYGLLSTVSSMGQFSGFSIKNCTVAAIRTLALPNNGGLSTSLNNTGNHYQDFSISIPLINFAKGIFCDGQTTDTNTNSHHNVFDNFSIVLPASNTTVTTWGLYLAACDNERFSRITYYNSGQSGSGINMPIICDFNNISSGGWPVDITVDAIDFGENGTQPTPLSVQYNLTPAAGFNVIRVTNISKGNGAPANPALAGCFWDPAVSGQLASSPSNAYTNNAAAQTATLTNAPLAGNPTKWIPINDNGTIRNVPSW